MSPVGNYRLGLAPRNAGHCRVCRAKFVRGEPRLEQASTSSSCLRCITCQQSRNVLRAYGSFEAAANPIVDEDANQRTIQALKAVWRPTKLEERSADLPVRVWSLEELDAKGGVVCLRSLVGEEHRVGLPSTTGRVRGIDIVQAIRQALPWLPCRERIVGADGKIVRESNDVLPASWQVVTEKTAMP